MFKIHELYFMVKKLLGNKNNEQMPRNFNYDNIFFKKSWLSIKRSHVKQKTRH